MIEIPPEAENRRSERDPLPDSIRSFPDRQTPDGDAQWPIRLTHRPESQAVKERAHAEKRAQSCLPALNWGAQSSGRLVVTVSAVESAARCAVLQSRIHMVSWICFYLWNCTYTMNMYSKTRTSIRVESASSSVALMSVSIKKPRRVLAHHHNFSVLSLLC